MNRQAGLSYAPDRPALDATRNGRVAVSVGLLRFGGFRSHPKIVCAEWSQRQSDF